ncbi:GGDEF domain-containing protein [Antarcticirhabdus aurantiaca]|uniref:GGDEF domain-containing protein n=1 Tax=Antarcticirhabdus aurantiaca TaxID=2606717 RepID=A0ACD4NKP7_9HYPH|nr:GGDEF domain-containing protein [Antarcticirhabdus aurantiaca]WAJ27358.1 GGDEF domain-containing protein [Jeongeuplla avenae]
MSSGDNFAFLLPIMMATFGVVFLIVARHGGRGAAAWGIGYLASGAAFAIPYVLGALPVVAQALLADALFLFAFVVYASALRSRFGLSPRWRSDIVLSLLAFAAIAYAVAVRGDLRAELMIGDIACTLLLLGPFARGLVRARRRIDWAILTVTGLAMADNILRNSLFAGLAGGDLEGFATSTYAFAMQASGSILALFLALAALAATASDVIEDHREAAERDPLSGLLNRRGFEMRSPAFGPGTAVRGTVVTCDIDHFKRVNDAFGHAAGDRVIAIIAAMLKRDLPAGALAARFGGEEFVLYLPEASPGEAVVLAERARLSFSLLDLAAAGITAALTASFGVAAVEPGDHSLHDALARADARLYAAKLAGRNRVIADGLSAFASAPGARLSAA